MKSPYTDDLLLKLLTYSTGNSSMELFEVYWNKFLTVRNIRNKIVHKGYFPTNYESDKAIKKTMEMINFLEKLI